MELYLSWETFRSHLSSRRRIFSKTLLKPQEFEFNAGFPIESTLVGTENILNTKLSEKDEVAIIVVNSPARVLFKHKSKMAGVSCDFKFLRRSVDGKLNFRFQIKEQVEMASSNDKNPRCVCHGYCHAIGSEMKHERFRAEKVTQTKN